MTSKGSLIKKVIELQRKADRSRRQYELDIWMSLPLTIGQLKSLFFISGQGTTTSGKLAAALSVTPTNITGIVDRLVKQGLVSRAEDPHDRRSLTLQATEKGEDLVTELRSRRTDYLSGAMERMSSDELEKMAAGLAAFVAAATDQEPEPHAGEKPAVARR